MTFDHQEKQVTMAEELMVEFAALTGLHPAGKRVQRYLWTDAFAVCNFLGLHRMTGKEEYKELALRLVAQVHEVLGRHREDDVRRGWISGLDEEAGKLHPTAGGLRIGKKMNERRPSDPLDDALEWDRDGQYFHYLTKWMHALVRVGRATGDALYIRWAHELARKAYDAFTYVPPSGRTRRMYWKMSTDLSFPLVSSMGLHDPLDGLVTYSEIEAAAHPRPELESPDVAEAVSGFAEMCAGRNFITDDPLGIGGLLSDAYKAASLTAGGAFLYPEILPSLLDAASQGLKRFARSNLLRLPLEYRLAFRELGLAIGVRAAFRLKGLLEENPERFTSREPLVSTVEGLRPYAYLIDEIESFWRRPAGRSIPRWAEHREINMVMLATSLAPDGYLAF